uniref:Uncharacterized protein n=1 Tax=Rhizophora mucronata TaxID=61149 RepID=A0A2P2PLI6_RHIMU
MFHLVNHGTTTQPHAPPSPRIPLPSPPKKKQKREYTLVVKQMLIIIITRQEVIIMYQADFL